MEKNLDQGVKIIEGMSFMSMLVRSDGGVDPRRKIVKVKNGHPKSVNHESDHHHT